MERQEGTLDVFLPSEAITRQSSADGINPATVRKALLDGFGDSGVVLQLVGRDGEITADPLLQPTDLLFWSWVPIFSDKARKLILELGASQDDFVRCQFTSRPGDAFFLHLPTHSFDFVDLATSQFTMVIPMQPPLPHGIRALSMRNVPEKMPPCFRLAVPGHGQVFGDLVVSEALFAAWSAALLTGAVFRKVA
jgi:hypothetical protein